MANLSRRSVLAGVPAATVTMATPVAGVAAVAVAAGPDAILAGMERDLARILTDLDVAYAEYVAAFRRFNAAKRGWQVPRLTDVGLRTRVGHDRQLARWRARLARLREEYGCDAAEARIEALREERDALCERSWHVHATDLAGLKVKARMAEHSNQVLGSIRADILAMVSP